MPFWSISSQKRVCVQREKHIKIHKQHTSLFNLISSTHPVVLTKNPTVIHRYQNRKEGSDSPSLLSSGEPWLHYHRHMNWGIVGGYHGGIVDKTPAVKRGDHRFESHPNRTIVYLYPQHSGNTDYRVYSA